MKTKDRIALLLSSSEELQKHIADTLEDGDLPVKAQDKLFEAGNNASRVTLLLIRVKTLIRKD